MNVKRIKKDGSERRKEGRRKEGKIMKTKDANRK